MEIRKLTTPEELRQAEEINSMSFYYNIPDDKKIEPEEGRTIWGVKEGDKVVSVVHVIEYEMMYHGAYVPMYGIGGVSTRAECRNRGYIRRLFEAIFAEMEQKKYMFSYLYPFSFAYYAKFGYAIAVTQINTRIPTWELKEFRCNLDVERYEPGQPWEPYEEVFRQFAAPYTGMVKRSKDWKRLENCKAYANQDYMYLFRREGKPVAYLRFAPHNVEGKPDALRDMRVKDIAWVDAAALVSVLGFVGGMWSHFGIFDALLPEDLPTYFLCGNPYRTEKKPQTCGQVRVTDVPAALAGYAWPREEGAFVLKVQDDGISSNNGSYQIRYGGGKAEVSVTGADPDAELDVRALSSLLFGVIGFADLPFLDPQLWAVHGREEDLQRAFVRRPTFINEYF